MERLTTRLESGRAIFAGNKTPVENALGIGEILESLAKYEDTGLTPEQVAALKDELRDERYRHDRMADFTVGQGQKIDSMKEKLEAARGEQSNVSPTKADRIGAMTDEVTGGAENA